MPVTMKTANPSQVVLAGAPAIKNYLLSFHRHANGLGELKRQATLSREGGYALFVLCIRFALRLITVFGIVFALVFRGLRHRVGFQLVGFTVEFHRSERYLQFFVLDLDDAPDHFRSLGNHGLSLYLDGCGEPRGKHVTDVVLVAGEGLAYCRADRCVLGPGLHRGWLRCFACDAGSLRRLSFLGSGSSLVGGLV